jgi:hypothetical protein
MTIDEALALREGDTICHPARLDYLRDGTPVKMPMRVTKVWQNTKRTIVLVRIAAVAHEAWLDATGYDLPPEGKVYDKLDREWITPAELKARKAERRNGTPAKVAPAA